MKFTRIIGVTVTLLFIVGLAAVADTPGRGEKNNGPQEQTPVQKYTMSLTLSDQAQKNTIAFDALAFLTGDGCSDTFLPPGKVADYAGFQYLRDNDATGMGHNTDFVTRASDNVLSILNDTERDAFITLSTQEKTLTDQYGYMRLPLMKAFRTQLDNNATSGGSLDKKAVMDYSAALYSIDADISLQRAKTYAMVIRSLNQTQRAYLDKMASGGMLTWPVVDVSDILKTSGRDNSVAMRTYASEMFAWYAGSVDADTYFCPERQATYFGSFYLKDRPAMGNPDYSISTTLTGDSGESFLNLLNDSQREKITGLVALQQADLNEIVTTRQAIATELRRSLTGAVIDENLVHSLSARYGELDGEISYYYATHFADVGSTLTSDQRQKMIALRNLGDYVCEGVYLYSQPISTPHNIPSDFLFGKGEYNEADLNAWILNQQQMNTSPNLGPEQGHGKGVDTVNSTLSPPEKPVPQGQDSRPDQERRLPVDDIISQLGQMGYDISGIESDVQSGDREAMKVWLDTFKQTNPGVVETVEGTGRKSSPGDINAPASSGSKKLPGDEP